MVPAGACGTAYISLFLLEVGMGKSMERVLGPVINELRMEGFIGRWEQERELSTVQKNRRRLNKMIRENRAIKETLDIQGKGKKHG
jgi:ribosomal protein S8